jgi:hypothetical protein
MQATARRLSVVSATSTPRRRLFRDVRLTSKSQVDTSEPTCFVIQAFDGSTFDRRYRETILPALKAAGVTPIRADEILGLQPIVTKIESAIRDASICLAEVSTDNPNVWLELGYALALDRPCVILCDKALREKLPFDISHRPVVFYRSDSASGFAELGRQIDINVRHEVDTATRIARTPAVHQNTESPSGLSDYEIEILATLLAVWPTTDGSLPEHELQKKLKASGYQPVALGLGLTRLVAQGLVLDTTRTERSYNDDFELRVFRISPDGIRWLDLNQNLLRIRKTDDDDIPF